MAVKKKSKNSLFGNAHVYTRGDPDPSGLTVFYIHYYHFDYYKKGVKKPNY